MLNFLCKSISRRRTSTRLQAGLWQCSWRNVGKYLGRARGMCSRTFLYLRKADRDVLLASLDHQQDPLCEALRCGEGSKKFGAQERRHTNDREINLQWRGLHGEKKRAWQEVYCSCDCGESRGHHLSPHRGKVLGRAIGWP
jgi:hypothetical protein